MNEADRFAAEAVAALGERAPAQEQVQDSRAGGEPAKAAGNEPAGSGIDPTLLELAKALSSAGATPEIAPEALRQLRLVSTTEGQQQFFDGFLASPAGQAVRAQLGQQHMASLLSTTEGRRQLVGVLREWGETLEPTGEEQDMAPEAREVKALRAQQAALENKVRQIEAGAGQKIQGLETALKARGDEDARKQGFFQWAGANKPMATEAYAAVSKRAFELNQLNPGRYAGVGGFKQAAADAHAELTQAANLFQPKQRPTALRGSGTGVVPAGGQEVKLDPASKTFESDLAKMIAGGAADFEAVARGQVE